MELDPTFSSPFVPADYLKKPPPPPGQSMLLTTEPQTEMQNILTTTSDNPSNQTNSDQLYHSTTTVTSSTISNSNNNNSDHLYANSSNPHDIRYSSSVGGGKKRDWRKVKRNFHVEWTEMFAVVKREEKPFCLVCQKVLSQMKVHSIRQHYNKLHLDFDHRFPANTETRTNELNRLAALLSPFASSASQSFNSYDITPSLEASSSRGDHFKEEPDDEEDDEEESDEEFDEQSQFHPQHSDGNQLMDSSSLDLAEHFLETSFSETNPTGQFSALSTLNSDSSNTINNSNKKRRDWTKVLRKFHHQWTDQYLVVECVQHQKPMCLICKKLISAMKVHNIKRHYLQLHAAYFEHHFPPGSVGRKNELCRLIEDFRKHQFRKHQLELDRTFISILSTPELADLDEWDEETEEFEDNSQQNGVAYQNNNYLYHKQQQQQQQMKKSGLTVDKLERAFSHLDKFIAIIEQGDTNTKRSAKVRSAIEVVVDGYKHMLNELKMNIINTNNNNSNNEINNHQNFVPNSSTSGPT